MGPNLTATIVSLTILFLPYKFFVAKFMGAGAE